MRKITVIYNTTSPTIAEESCRVTDEDTVKSARLVAETLSLAGWGTSLLEVKPENVDSFAIDTEGIIFNMCEWLGHDYAIEIRLLKRLEELGVAYTGGDSKSYAWGSDKEKMKQMLDQQGLPTPLWFVFNTGKINWSGKVTFPAIVKPGLEHCSVGVDAGSVVKDVERGKRRIQFVREKYNQPVLVEKFVPGNEYQVFVLEKREGLLVLPPCETVYRTGLEVPMLSFEENWIKEDVSDKIERIGEAPQSPVRSKVMAIAQEAFKKLGCRGYVRLDIREDGGNIYILELNVNPRIAWDSECDMRVSAEAAGMSLGDLLQMIVEAAIRT